MPGVCSGGRALATGRMTSRRMSRPVEGMVRHSSLWCLCSTACRLSVRLPKIPVPRRRGRRCRDRLCRRARMSIPGG